MKQLTLSYFARFDPQELQEQTTIDQWGDRESPTAQGGEVSTEDTR